MLQQSGTPKWTDIVMPMECSDRDDEWDKIDDHAKVMRSMHRVMRSDTRRRFVHGLTCKDTQARLWYHDRSDVVASQTLDINNDWKHLVRIVLCMLLAPPDRLGFDPDVDLLPSHGPDADPNYDIIIRNSETGETTTYRTLKMAFNFEIDDIDMWTDESRVAEHITLKEIREAQPSYAQYFLTPLDHGFAYFSVAAPDNTHKTLRRVELMPTNNILVTRSDNMSDWSQIILDAPRDTEDMSKSRQEGRSDSWYLSKHPLQHYRMIFKESGTPIQGLRDWTDIFMAIQGGWEGVHAMNLCGHFHRNVNARNILLVPSSDSLGQRGVIMDLHCAKKLDSQNAPRRVQMRAAEFMPTEAAYYEHHRLKDLRRATMNLHPDHASGSSSSDESQLGALPPFRHNQLHDMEVVVVAEGLLPSISESTHRPP
ncbi:kinase domain protein, putative [Rhizoctonia solani AG-3 Rhs1AP]|uniref:Kinase domain protein, putative n=1 Tax=Rhizoctonia solani AG-3 Rhs1AP TaxID=1086054 RepID=X8J3A1_9AGAM|nr:kinase domain protein, putative [Rhizoctonia solani AG-3 Rhs1AP]